MKPADFFFDLKDLIGMFVPGFLILLIVGLFAFLDVSNNQISVRDAPFIEFCHSVQRDATPVYWTVVITISYVVGNINRMTVFKIRDLLMWNCDWVPSVQQFLDRLDKSGKLKPFYTSEFEADILDQPYHAIHEICKHSLADSAPNAFNTLLRKEAGVNFAGGMITPCIMAVVWFYWNAHLILGAVTAAAAVGLCCFARNAFRREMLRVYQYYYVHKARESSSRSTILLP